MTFRRALRRKCPSNAPLPLQQDDWHFQNTQQPKDAPRWRNVVEDPEPQPRGFFIQGSHRKDRQMFHARTSTDGGAGGEESGLQRSSGAQPKKVSDAPEFSKSRNR